MAADSCFVADGTSFCLVPHAPFLFHVLVGLLSSLDDFLWEDILQSTIQNIFIIVLLSLWLVVLVSSFFSSFYIVVYSICFYSLVDGGVNV